MTGLLTVPTALPCPASVILPVRPCRWMPTRPGHAKSRSNAPGAPWRPLRNLTLAALVLASLAHATSWSSTPALGAPPSVAMLGVRGESPAKSAPTHEPRALPLLSVRPFADTVGAPVTAGDRALAGFEVALPQPDREASWASCALPEVTHRWEGRNSDDEWMPGIYPATQRVPGGTMALTFDDGPMRGSGALLDALQDRGMHASFFLTGWSIKSTTYPHVRRALAEGHALGNHGWRHDTDMAQRFANPEKQEAYMAAELELTQIRVDFAMLAESPEDFRAMDRQVFAGLSIASSHEEELDAMPALRARHAALLQARGYSETHRPHKLRWVRPPGGNPYMGARFLPHQREAFARAADAQGLVLVMWNSGSGDSDPRRSRASRMDPERLSDAIGRAARRGGIFVAHDRIAKDGLIAMLDHAAALRERGELRLVALDTLRYEQLARQGRCPTGPQGAE